MRNATSLYIRSLKPDDVEQACEAHHSAVRACAPGPYTAEMMQAWEHSLDQERMRKHLQRKELVTRGAFVGGRLYGFMLLDQNRLWALYVHGDHQGQGLGRELLQLAEELAACKGHKRLQLRSALPVVGFYEHCGYRVTDKAIVVLDSGLLLECAMMEKALPPFKIFSQGGSS